MTRLALVPARPVARKPTYVLWPIYACGMAINRVAEWRAKHEAEESERNRAQAQALSRQTPAGGRE